MTGIEQLRKLGADAVRGGEVGRAICDIADQIERERECERDTIENLRLELGEARDDAAWVREHGGLERVKDLLDWVVGHCSTKQQLDFDFWLSGRVMHELGFEEDMADREEVERRLLARLMPEGMEWLVEAWPRFADDSPVHFGDTALIDGEADMVEAVQLWIHGKPVIYGDCGSQQLEKGERVRRPIADTWERLEKDVAGVSCPDVYCANHHIDASDTSYEWAMARDIVLRARALAGVSE